MNILVLGSAGREHAICDAFIKSKKLTKLYCLPGNAGSAVIAQNISDIALNDHEKIIKFCQNNNIDLVFIGPEQPLVDGIVDDLAKNNIRVFGPQKKAARLEGSKIFMKDLAKKYQVSTAKYQTFFNQDLALKYLDVINYPSVIKTDGLAAGKGVIIAQNKAQAHDEIKEFFSGKFGEAGKKLIIEEFLDGFEVSYFIIVDGKNYKSLGFAHDYKKVGDNNTGLNTGGMGTYSPSHKISKDLENKINKEIIEPTINGLKNEDCEFVGILFAGLMIQNNEPKLLEFNIRFGDPEAQVILPRLETDFIDLILSATKQDLNNLEVKFDEKKHALCVVMAAKGYPGSYQKNCKINLDNVDTKNAKIFHAGTKMIDNQILSNGGRVLNVVGFGNSKQDAKNNAYKAVSEVDFEDGFYRSDIGS